MVFKSPDHKGPRLFLGEDVGEGVWLVDQPLNMEKLVKSEEIFGSWGS